MPTRARTRGVAIHRRRRPHRRVRSARRRAADVASRARARPDRARRATLARAARRRSNACAQRGPVLVCCALGYSRSACAVAAWLLATGRAATRRRGAGDASAQRAHARSCSASGTSRALRTLAPAYAIVTDTRSSAPALTRCALPPTRSPPPCRSTRCPTGLTLVAAAAAAHRHAASRRRPHDVHRVSGCRARARGARASGWLARALRRRAAARSRRRGGTRRQSTAGASTGRCTASACCRPSKAGRDGTRALPRRAARWRVRSACARRRAGSRSSPCVLGDLFAAPDLVDADPALGRPARGPRCCAASRGRSPAPASCGSAARPPPTQRVYYANHSSHGDFALIWACLPADLRERTRPVAGADYWRKGTAAHVHRASA